MLNLLGFARGGGTAVFDDFVNVPHPEDSPMLTPNYKPLGTKRDEIRLLNILPSLGNDSEPIKCSLEHSEFRDNPSYEALSYTRGTQQQTEPIIIVDGQSVTVRENLWLALKNLRQPSQHRIMWIDAICINQNNIEERNRQVRLMPFIYQRAKSVLVWLRPDVNICASVLSKLNRPYITDVLRKDTLAKAQLATLCESEYWKRLWIIQEIEIATKILVRCGSSWTLWTLFIHALETCFEFKNCIPLRLEGHRKDRYSLQNRLSNLIESHQYALCEDPRDKIFGLVGLAVDVDDDTTLVDYSRSTEEVYKDVIEFQYPSEIRLNHGIPSDDHSKLPSTKILHFCRLLQQLLNVRCPRPRPCDPTENLSKGKLTSSKGIFRLDADVVGRIQYVGPAFGDILGSFHATKQWDRALRQLKAQGDNDTIIRRNNDKFIEELLELSHSDLSRFGALALGISWKQAPEFPLPLPDISLFNAYKTIYPEPTDSLQTYGEPRVVSIRNCLSGLAPHNAEEGDLICLLREMPITLVLRQTGDRFTIVGRALVQRYNLGSSAGLLDDDFKSSLKDFPSGILMDLDTLGFLAS
jgi:hypothetical protein